MLYNNYRVFDFILHNQKNYHQTDTFSYKKNNTWHSISIDEFVDKGNQLSSSLLKSGITKGDNICIISNTRWEFHLIDFATLQIGGVLVPLYVNLLDNEYKIIIEEAQPKIIFVYTEALAQRINNIIEALKLNTKIYTIEPFSHFVCYKNLLKEVNINALLKCRESVSINDLATIIYTSGTEGKPKGVMLSHLNLVSNVIDSYYHIEGLSSKDRALSALPLNHIYERTCSYIFMYAGIRLYYAESLLTIGDNLREKQITVFACVPLLIGKMYDKIITKGQTLTGLKKKIFFWAVDVAKKWDNQKPLSLWYQLQLAIADKLIFSKWRAALGGQLRLLISGSAAINPLYIRVFNAAKIGVREGYGLTETSPVVAVNKSRIEDIRIGTVGQLINNVEIKIADDGEILIKGNCVMMGYYKNKELTDKVLSQDKWFATGDIGVFDGTYLKITDRKKEIFKTMGGKYIAPQMIENKLKESSFIEYAIIVGEYQEVVGAIIQPSFEKLKQFAKEKNIAYDTIEELVEKKEIKQLFSAQIDETNKSLASYEKIRRFALCSKQWTVENEELTPTLKIKRRIIMKNYKHLYDQMFA